MVINYLGRAETNDKGQVRVFFDLNGQPRTITVPDRLKVGDIQVRAKAALGDAKQVGAPMPGVISSLSVKVGDKVAAGDVLLSIEAMKMETAIHAETDGVIAEADGEAGRPDRRQGSADPVRVTLRSPRPSPWRWRGSRPR